MNPEVREGARGVIHDPCFYHMHMRINDEEKCTITLPQYANEAWGQSMRPAPMGMAAHTRETYGRIHRYAILLTANARTKRTPDSVSDRLTITITTCNSAATIC